MLLKKRKKRIMFRHILKDTIQIARMKKLALNPVYSCSGEMYKLLSYKVMHKLVKKIKKGEVHLSNDLTYDRDIITTEEKFLENLNRYIGFVKDNYFMEHMEQLYLIELSLSNKYNEVLYSLLEYTADENYKYYEDQFRKMFLYNFYNNILFFGKYANETTFIKKFINKFRNYDFNSIDGIKKIEGAFKKINKKRKKSLFNAFLPFTEYEDRTFNFYFNQIEVLLETYFK